MTVRSSGSATTITYTIYAQNNGALACDITNATITLQLPGADGTPNGTAIVITRGLDMPSNSERDALGPVPTPSTSTPGVDDARRPARPRPASCTTRRRPPGRHRQDPRHHGRRQPGIEVTKVGSIQNGAGAAERDVHVHGLQPHRAAAAARQRHVSATASARTSWARSPGSDANGDRRLDPTEVWTYTCTMTHPAAGQYDNTVTACAELILNGDATTRSATTRRLRGDAHGAAAAGRGQAGRGQPGAVHAGAGQCDDRARRAAEHDPRAGERRRRRREDHADRCRAARSTPPRPPRTGSRRSACDRRSPAPRGSRAPACSDVERLSVKPARRVVAQRAPRVTG